VEAKPLEIVAGFGALVAGGRRTAATFLINRSGSAEQIMSREASYMVLQMLRSTTGDVPADVRGTFSWGKQAMGLDSGSQVAAKTGTTDDRRSLWIVGLFKDLAVLVVVSSNHSMPAGSQGASVAGPLLARFVREARSSPEAWRFAGGFDPPPTVVQKSVDRRSGCELPDGTDQEWFPLDRLPPPCSYLQ
jgi:membrane peptidoglycan carboxypeptidase